MKYLELLTLQVALLSGAAAESSLPQDVPTHPTVPVERRVELRSVLQERRTPTPTDAQASGGVNLPRRLTPQEQLDLRQQLRRPRQGDVRNPP